MVVNADGRVAGSVSGGCVEGAVVEAALEVLASGVPRRVDFGYSDADAFAVGLTCGGDVGIFITPELLPFHDELDLVLRSGTPVVVATVVEAGGRTDAEAHGLVDQFTYRPDVSDEELRDRPTRPGASLLITGDGVVTGSLGQESLDRTVVRDALGMLYSGRSALRTYGTHGEARGLDLVVFIESFSAPPEMVIFGAVDFSAALATVAKVLGYHVTVCDARPSFATSERFPMADTVVVDWPQRFLASKGPSLGPRDAVCVLTHDPKFDVPAIVAAVATDVGYIGAMGSRRTHRERLERLRAAGLSESAIDRVMAPIGLDIGAASPEEVALSICAEIVATRAGRSTNSLRDGTGPIHAARPA
jgi:xanthine dehydrogenase accessory factor